MAKCSVLLCSNAKLVPSGVVWSFGSRNSRQILMELSRGHCTEYLHTPSLTHELNNTEDWNSWTSTRFVAHCGRPSFLSQWDHQISFDVGLFQHLLQDYNELWALLEVKNWTWINWYCFSDLHWWDSRAFIFAVFFVLCPMCHLRTRGPSWHFSAETTGFFHTKRPSFCLEPKPLFLFLCEWPFCQFEKMEIRLKPFPLHLNASSVRLGKNCGIKYPHLKRSSWNFHKHLLGKIYAWNKLRKL